MIDLTGKWALRDENGEFDLPMNIPGDSVTAMQEAGHLKDPYWGKNEYSARWIADREWRISRTFAFSPDGANRALKVSGLDCVAEISINGNLALSAANAFRIFHVEVTDFLRAGENTIEILFRSNTAEANRRQDAQPYEVPFHAENCDIPNGNMLRKCQSDFGWDWNLALAPFGISGEINIQKSADRIRRIATEQKHSADYVDLIVRVDLENARDGQRFDIRFGDQTASGQITGNSITAEFHVNNPKIWWPAGLGDQHLYHLAVTVGAHTEQRKIGLRTVELLTEPDDIGAEFAFAVNGHRIFARGANWIPQDALSGRITKAATRDLLQSAVDANMNMIRVWGGGRYEADWFYNMCSELGLLVWQDFMFSCNLYPSDKAFLADVDQEIRDQVARLSHHACIALWCGDNELIGALGWFDVSIKNRDRYLVGYDRLNRTIETALSETDPLAIWWPSSPSPGLMNFGDAWHDDSSGDMHYWAVWHEGKSFDNYREIKPRFCSEFGFQSFPSMNTIRKFATEKDLNIGSPVMESHQKNAGGNARITETMFRYFRFPQGFENFVYLSQVQQGLAMQTAVNFWRSIKPRCMGALYWQLNDTWPTMSWSGLNHGGDWKLMHFMARRFFEPVTISIIPDGENLKVMAVNDTLSAQTVSVELYTLAMDGTRTALQNTTGNVGIDASETLLTLKADRIPPGHILGFSYDAGNGRSGRDHYTPAPYKALDMVDSEVSFAASVSGNQVIISTTTKSLALFVSVEAGVVGRFSDNCYMQLPGETIEVIFTPTEATAEDALETIFVRDLYSATY